MYIFMLLVSTVTMPYGFMLGNRWLLTQRRCPPVWQELLAVGHEHGGGGGTVPLILMSAQL